MGFKEKLFSFNLYFIALSLGVLTSASIRDRFILPTNIKLKMAYDEYYGGRKNIPIDVLFGLKPVMSMEEATEIMDSKRKKNN